MPPRAKMMDRSEAYSRLAAELEDQQDLSGQVIGLDRFFEDEAWCDMVLRPRQRMLAKIIDAASNHQPIDGRMTSYTFDEATTPLDFNPGKLLENQGHCVGVTEDGHYTYDEVADLAYLLGRRNKYAQIINNLDYTSNEPVTIVLIIGRGGGKTTFSAGVSAHQAHRILSAPDPHGMFGLEPLKALRIQNVATSSSQAGEFFDAFCTLLDRVRWFDGRFAPAKMGIVKFGRHLWAEKTSSNSKSSRGRDTVIYVHDEIAFAEKTTGARSDRALYKAIRSAVKTRAKGRGLVLILSSPAEADGVLYELYTQGLAGKLENSLIVQMASWEMMPGQTKGDYAAEFRRDDDVAEMEYGSQFFTGAKTFLPNVADRFGYMEQAYRDLVGTDGFRLYPKHMPTPQETDTEDERWRKTQRRYERVIHCDTSEGGDRLIVKLLHVRGGMVVVDLVRCWEREIGYTKELIPFIRHLAKRVSVSQVSFDQFASHQAIQDIEDMGIKAVKTPFTQQYNDEIARNLRQVVFEDRLALPPVDEDLWNRADSVLDKPGWDDDDTQWPMLSQIVLRREMMAALKHIKGRFVSAQAPTAGPTQTDDALDALMAATHQAILLYGGTGDFFTIPRTTMGLEKTDEVVQADKPAAVRQSVFCSSHRGYVFVESAERFAPCPTCAATLQLKI